MRHAMTMAVLLAGLANAAWAADPAPFEWTKSTFDLVASGDSAEGEKLAKQYRCKKCHNEDGISDDEDIPSIAGQRATYMYKQLWDFRHSLRGDEDMIKVAKKLSEDDMVHISAWYASLDRPPMRGGEPLLVVKICDSCHDKDIVEKDNHIEVAPIITGQIRQYLERSMLAFKKSDRANDLFFRMQSVSHKLSDDEIRALAAYYGAPEEQ